MGHFCFNGAQLHVLKKQCECAFKKVRTGCGLLVTRFPDQYDFHFQTAKGGVPSSVTRVLEAVMGTLVSSMFVMVAERLSQVD